MHKELVILIDSLEEASIQHLQARGQARRRCIMLVH